VLKKITQKLIHLVQKVLISVLLCVVYYVVFGLTVVIAFLFNRGLLRGKKHVHDSTWIDAAGYGKDLLDSKMQS
jgi:hypothetical protein